MFCAALAGCAETPSRVDICVSSSDFYWRAILENVSAAPVFARFRCRVRKRLNANGYPIEGRSRAISTAPHILRLPRLYEATPSASTRREVDLRTVRMVLPLSPVSELFCRQYRSLWGSHVSHTWRRTFEIFSILYVCIFRWRTSGDLAATRQTRITPAMLPERLSFFSRRLDLSYLTRPCVVRAGKAIVTIFRPVLWKLNSSRIWGSP